ncbi:hypothetical protein HNQ53_000918 [Microbulbifer hydrolyticus]|uniref:Uncharacterized protein n=1 Tax=Microbulbifer hydrolyticus TaxID=48074 RepID=A0AA89T4V4_9GAMM|nr:hypothetical protein [Microbulbifer hydrolyticus]
MPNITDEPYRGAIADLSALQQPGLQTFRRYIHVDLPLPPIWRLASTGYTGRGKDARRGYEGR